MNLEFFSFLEQWKERYGFFLMDRVSYIDEEEKTYIFAYVYPMRVSDKVERIKEYPNNGTINFERIKLTTNEVKEMVKNLQVDSNNRKVTILYPDGEKFDLKTEQSPLEERMIVAKRYGKTGMYTPCYRLKIKAKNRIFTDEEFSTASIIGYTNIATATKDIFRHNDRMFSRDNFPTDIKNPLIIDLTHFEWKIQGLYCLRNIVEIEILSMEEKQSEKPIGKLNVEFTNGKSELRTIPFEKNFTKQVFSQNIANVHFYLQSPSNTGFKGTLDKPKARGKILDLYNYRKFHIYQSDYINLDELSPSKLQKLIQRKESDTLELKSIIQSKQQENFYWTIGKQMTAMANAQAKGLVILGVDKTGLIEGVADFSLEDFRNNLQEVLDSNCDPWLDFDIKEFEITVNNQKKRLIVLSLLAEKKKRPYLYRKKRNTYELPLRRGDSTKWLSPKEIRDFLFEIYKEQKSTTF
ncbi:MAG: ATP-binding protein [Candidatus Heimdallarchaeaceae archaeon]